MEYSISCSGYIQAYYTDDGHGVKISFVENIPYTSKFVTYNFSSFMIDIGSSLGKYK